MRYWFVLLALTTTQAQAELPPRDHKAPTGTTLAATLKPMSLIDREAEVSRQFLAGNVPSWLRSPVPITVRSGENTITFYAWPDYLAIGSDTDFLRIPLSPLTAQALAAAVDCMLPTPKMVDLIHEAAAIKLSPEPIAPTPAMTTVPVFFEHNAKVEAHLGQRNHNGLVAGHKKDVVISAKLKTNTGKVAIYGWHKLDHTPIQPLYLGHFDTWVDYSHGIRFVQKTATLNGKPTSLATILAEPKLAPMLSSEGVITQPRYAPAPKLIAGPGEVNETLRLDHGVRVVINRPQNLGTKPVLVVFYALPNGNTIEQTMGKNMRPEDDWHFDIQHIAAQLRFIRTHQNERPIVIAYLENDLRSWPNWRKTHGDREIPAMLSRVLDRMPAGSTISLTGHSGGGSLTFGYINTQATIPNLVERIGFLDANYAYEPERHRDKLLRWLEPSDRNVLVVLAYNDAIATLDGKPFVSAKGGTWGRMEQMIADMKIAANLKSDDKKPIETWKGSAGRLVMIRHHNPEKKILHTIQVEKNGLIEVMSIHTPTHNKDFTYFSDRAYNSYIIGD